MILLRRVVGESMLPALRPGQLVVAVRTPRLRVGDVVIARHHKRDKLKRVQSVQGGQVFLLGDNPARSTDSRSFGWLPATAVIAKIVWPKTRRQA